MVSIGHVLFSPRNKLVLFRNRLFFEGGCQRPAKIKGECEPPSFRSSKRVFFLRACSHREGSEKMLVPAFKDGCNARISWQLADSIDVKFAPYVCFHTAFCPASGHRATRNAEALKVGSKKKRVFPAVSLLFFFEIKGTALFRWVLVFVCFIEVSEQLPSLFQRKSVLISDREGFLS